MDKTDYKLRVSSFSNSYALETSVNTRGYGTTGWETLTCFSEKELDLFLNLIKEKNKLDLKTKFKNANIELGHYQDQFALATNIADTRYKRMRKQELVIDSITKELEGNKNG